MADAKPTIFLSHSSGDKQILARLRGKVLEKTGSAVQIFLSSDGQSIKLGRNWVHEIELALARARLMFVFVTPRSSQSQWVYFESGHAYARGIQVIPIGFDGVDLSSVRPPLSLLQGFNIAGPEGLNNLLAVLNDEFDMTFPESFTNEDFDEIMSSGPEGALSLGGRTTYVDELHFSFKCDPEAGSTAVLAAIESRGLQSRMGGDTIESHGMRVKVVRDQTPENCGLRFVLDSRLMGRNIGVIDQVLETLKIAASTVFIQVTFMEGVEEEEKFTRLSSLLFGEGVQLAPNDMLLYRGIQFKLHHWSSHQRGKTYMLCTYLDGKLSDIPLDDLLEILFRQGVLTVTSPYTI